MNFADFEARAREVFDSIPREYREGVAGLEVERRAALHPELPEIFTLGECRSEFYPSEYGGPGDVSSVVVLYYGSFLELARREEEWDWDGEIWETITHEIRHHLESLAAEDALEVRDYAEDQNFARREGEPFEPFFYRSGARLAEDAFRIDSDVFVERSVDDRSFRDMLELELRWDGRTYAAPRPERLGDVHFVRLGETEDGGDLYAVLVRSRGTLGFVRSLFGGGRLEVLETDASEEEGLP